VRQDYKHDWIDVSLDWVGRAAPDPECRITLSGRGEDNEMVVIDKWTGLRPILSETTYWEIRQAVATAVGNMLQQQFLVTLHEPFD
jgi:hypothetical protein